MIRRWLQRRRHGGGQPTPAGTARLVVLDDEPVHTFIGWREWCSGKPSWDDGRCLCAHTENRYRR